MSSFQLDYARRLLDSGECPLHKVTLGTMVESGEYRKYWEVLANDGEWTLGVFSTKEIAEYVISLINSHAP